MAHALAKLLYIKVGIAPNPPGDANLRSVRT